MPCPTPTWKANSQLRIWLPRFRDTKSPRRRTCHPSLSTARMPGPTWHQGGEVSTPDTTIADAEAHPPLLGGNLTPMTGLPPIPNAQARTFLSSQPRHNTPIQESDVPMRRAEMRAECLTGGQPEPIASITRLRAGGVPARLYHPVGDEREILVWLHGGAWMLGDLDCCDAAVRALANRGGCAVLVVDYRLAPEHRYPAAVEDSW